jgi:hypothetical protein
MIIIRFCDQLKLSGNSALINAYLPDALNSLINMSTQYREDALSLILETLSIVISVSKNSNSDCYYNLLLFVSHVHPSSRIELASDGMNSHSLF